MKGVNHMKNVDKHERFLRITLISSIWVVYSLIMIFLYWLGRSFLTPILIGIPLAPLFGIASMIVYDPPRRCCCFYY